MKLLNVTAADGFLTIHTDKGIRRRVIGEFDRDWMAVRVRAVSLIGKDVITTTVGGWDPLVWFWTIDEAPSATVTATRKLGAAS